MRSNTSFTRLGQRPQLERRLEPSERVLDAPQTSVQARRAGVRKPGRFRRPGGHYATKQRRTTKIGENESSPGRNTACSWCSSSVGLGLARERVSFAA